MLQLPLPSIAIACIILYVCDARYSSQPQPRYRLNNRDRRETSAVSSLLNAYDSDYVYQQHYAYDMEAASSNALAKKSSSRSARKSKDAWKVVQAATVAFLGLGGQVNAFVQPPIKAPKYNAMSGKTAANPALTLPKLFGYIDANVFDTPDNNNKLDLLQGMLDSSYADHKSQAERTGVALSEDVKRTYQKLCAEVRKINLEALSGVFEKQSNTYERVFTSCLAYAQDPHCGQKIADSTGELFGSVRSGAKQKKGAVQQYVDELTETLERDIAAHLRKARSMSEPEVRKQSRARAKRVATQMAERALSHGQASREATYQLGSMVLGDIMQAGLDGVESGASADVIEGKLDAWELQLAHVVDEAGEQKDGSFKKFKAVADESPLKATLDEFKHKYGKGEFEAKQLDRLRDDLLYVDWLRRENRIQRRFLN